MSLRARANHDPTPLGANELISTSLGIPALIVENKSGWIVTLPSPIPAGHTASYDIVWGKIGYFGWQEALSTPPRFHNLDQEIGTSHYGYVRDAWLSPNEAVWYCATRGNNVSPTGDFCDTNAWAFFNITSFQGDIVPELLLRHERGSCGTVPAYSVKFAESVFAIGSGRVFLLPPRYLVWVS